TFPGGLEVVSNEVLITVVSNSVIPASPQSILVGVNGDTLTVRESPTGMWREWKYATVAGGPYVSFAPPITGATTYVPNFSVAGIYYVICLSEINNVFVTSNEVIISVGNATLSTGPVVGSPFEFSLSAPDAMVLVPYTTNGTFNAGNTFTAQLSDANGSFTNPTDIGSLADTIPGIISAIIPATTIPGTRYRIRVISDNPVVLGSDNGTNLVVDQFGNFISPATTQTIQHSTNGSAITVAATQSATHEWKYSTTSGTAYTSFVPAETGSAYIPNFSIPGTYYIVAVSTNTYTDEVISNEVAIVVTNGSVITTLAVSGSPFLVSANLSPAVNVDFTSDVVFNSGNVFKAQLSDNTGNFTSPVEIGTLAGTSIGTISASIPSSSVAGAGYRIRVISTNPAVTGSDNGNNLLVVPFEVSVAPADTQRLMQGQFGTAISVAETHPATRVWKYSQSSGLGYTTFNPSETGATLTPRFNIISPYYIVCESTNSASDKVVSQEVVIIVTAFTGINDNEYSSIKAYWNGNDFMVDLSGSELVSPSFALMNANGQVVMGQKLNSSVLNKIATNLPEGIYIFSIKDGEKVYTGKTSKR
ncbi:MAG: T9SS type A sorting domain-containing protein, partial [Bacteroidota bacterium]